MQNSLNVDGVSASSSTKIPVGSNFANSNHTLAPSDGGLGLDKTSDIFYFAANNVWNELLSVSAGVSHAWLTTGNTGTDGATNYIGTTDAQPFRIVAGGVLAGPGSTRFTVKGQIEILGTNNCIFIGEGAGSANVMGSGTDNTFVGYQAGAANTTADFNTALGSNALRLNTTGSPNTAIGTSSLAANTTGSRNVAVGYSTLLVNTTGNDNTMVGYQAGNSSTTADFNTALGSNALRFATTGGQNTAVGTSSLTANTTGSGNVAMGYGSLVANTTGARNVAVGHGSLAAITTAVENVAIGFSALALNTASNNTAVGNGALSLNTSGTHLVAIGSGALNVNTTGTGLTAVGYNALSSNTTGVDNTALGERCMENATAAIQCVAVGTLALNAITTGSNNTACGKSAGVVMTTAANNSLFGINSMSQTTTGSNNCGFGYQTLTALTISNGNTAVGFNALAAIVTGANNTAIGNGAGQALSGADSDNIMIGNVGVVNDVGTIRIGIIGSHTKSHFYGIRGTTTANADAIAVVIDSAGQLGTVSSDRRLKDGIVAMNDIKDNVMSLKPSRFYYKSDASQKLTYGLIAQEVEEIFPELVVVSHSDLQTEEEYKTVLYQHIPMLLLRDHQRLSKLVDEQQELIESLMAHIDL